MGAMRLLAFCLLLLGRSAFALPSDGCLPAIQAAERARETPPGLLGAIGVVESGRADPRTGGRTPWPWTVTAGGVGTVYPGKAEAIAGVLELQARGTTSIDVGCMQVNLAAHPGAFRNLEQAFDPASNTLYAARFLAGLFQRVGTWTAATAAYHSMTPERGAQYGRLVAAVLGGAPVPVVSAGGGAQVVLFPDGGRLRVVRDAAVGPGRVVGFLSGP